MKNLNEVAPRVVKADWLNQIELELRSIKFDEKKAVIKAIAVITKDNYNYEKEGDNKYEKVNITCENIKEAQIPNIKLGRKVKLDKISSVSTFGDYNENLSLKASVSFYD